MKPKFSTTETELIFSKDGKVESHALPRHTSEMVGVKAFIDDLNRRIEKLSNVTHDMITVNSHYVFITYKENITIRVKLPDVKTKHLAVRKETHQLAKIGASKANLPVKDYVHLCLVQCQSDVS